jgi:hypothetical protein
MMVRPPSDDNSPRFLDQDAVALAQLAAGAPQVVEAASTGRCVPKIRFRMDGKSVPAPTGRFAGRRRSSRDKQQIEPMLGKLGALPDRLCKPETLLADSRLFQRGPISIPTPGTLNSMPGVRHGDCGLTRVCFRRLPGRHFAIDTDVNNLLSPDLPWRQQELRFSRAFPQGVGTIFFFERVTSISRARPLPEAPTIERQAWRDATVEGAQIAVGPRPAERLPFRPPILSRRRPQDVRASAEPADA